MADANDDDDEEDSGLALTPFNVRIFMAFFFFVLFFDGIFLVSFLIQKKSYTVENFFLA